MKKVLFVLALVAAYGVSMAMSSSNVVTVDEMSQVIVMTDVNENNVTPEGEKEKEKAATTKTAKAKGDAKAEGCSGSKAKAEGCAEKAKSDCSSSCGGEKKK